jgi:hypothetical protein
MFLLEENLQSALRLRAKRNFGFLRERTGQTGQLLDRIFSPLCPNTMNLPIRIYRQNHLASFSEALYVVLGGNLIGFLALVLSGHKLGLRRAAYRP